MSVHRRDDKTVEEGLASFDADDRDDVVILFSAHSLPLDVINRGDAYPGRDRRQRARGDEAPRLRHEYLLAYQSDVGPVPWLGPSTEKVLEQLGASAARTSWWSASRSPATTSRRCTSSTSSTARWRTRSASRQLPPRRRAQRHAAVPGRAGRDRPRAPPRGEACSPNYGLRCPGCVNPQCRAILNPVKPYRRTPVTTSPKNKQYPTA
jgi:protoporphyrin/coproporphyrin ferrochelatase